MAYNADEYINILQFFLGLFESSMREAAFIKKNKEKWLFFEDILQKKVQVSPDQLSDLYIEITDDLSYAKTFYPQSNTATANRPGLAD